MQYSGPQSAGNTAGADQNITPQMAQIMQTRFTRAAYLYKIEGKWWVQDSNAVESDRTTPIPVRAGSSYTPSFPVRAITTNDNDEDGMEAEIEMANIARFPVRLYSGLDRPYGVTRVHLNVYRDIDTIILLG